jgi:hypothetical protein
MYQSLFIKLRHQAPKLQLYHDGPLTTFDGTTTRPLELIMLPITFRDNDNPYHATQHTTVS